MHGREAELRLQVWNHPNVLFHAIEADADDVSSSDSDASETDSSAEGGGLKEKDVVSGQSAVDEATVKANEKGVSFFVLGAYSATHHLPSCIYSD